MIVKNCYGSTTLHSSIKLGDKLTIILASQNTNDCLYEMQTQDGETVATSSDPRCMSKYAFECGAQVVKHDYDLASIDSGR